MTNKPLVSAINALKRARHFFSDRDGAAAIEYALMAGLLAVSLIMGAGNLGQATSETFNEINDAFSDGQPGGGKGQQSKKSLGM